MNNKDLIESGKQARLVEELEEKMRLVEELEEKTCFMEDVLPEVEFERTCRDLCAATRAFLGEACEGMDKIVGQGGEALKPPENPIGGDLGELYCGLVYIEHLARILARQVAAISTKI